MYINFKYQYLFGKPSNKDSFKYKLSNFNIKKKIIIGQVILNTGPKHRNPKPLTPKYNTPNIGKPQKVVTPKSGHPKNGCNPKTL